MITISYFIISYDIAPIKTSVTVTFNRSKRDMIGIGRAI